MIQVAILWYWNQWKKHAYFWRNIWVEPIIFTRIASENNLSIEALIPADYNIIICAIYPLDEQTRILNHILHKEYSGYLIIEKPITFSKKLLEILVNRNKTIFFIDEAYVHIDIDIRKIYEIKTTSYMPDDALSVQEHAIGYTLRSSMWMLSYRHIDTSHALSTELCYTLTTDTGIIRSVNGVISLDWVWVPFSFDMVYMYILCHISDDEMMGTIRSNYLNFRLQSPYWSLSYEQ